MTFLLGLYLGIAIGYCICYPTRRIRYAFIGGTREQDQAAIRAAIQAEVDQRFDQITARLDHPDDPRSST